MAHKDYNIYYLTLHKESEIPSCKLGLWRYTVFLDMSLEEVLFFSVPLFPALKNGVTGVPHREVLRTY